MIFISLGSQKFQFNRLLKAVDNLVESGVITDQVFAQTGYSDYLPKNFEYEHHLDRADFAERMGRSDIVITHGGTGSIIGAVKKNKKVIAIPRLPKYGEHVDDHQLQIIAQFENSHLICSCMDCDNLGEMIEYAKKTEFNHYQSNTQRILDSLEEFIEEDNG